MSRGVARLGLALPAGVIILVLSVALAYSAGSSAGPDAPARVVVPPSAGGLAPAESFVGHVAYIEAISRPDFKGCLVFFYPRLHASFHLVVTDHRLEGLFMTALASGNEVQLDARRYAVPPTIAGEEWAPGGVYFADSLTVMSEK